MTEFLNSKLSTRNSKLFLLPLHLFDDLGNEEREDEQADGKENLERDQLAPVAGDPDLFEGADEEGEYEGADDDAQTGAHEIVHEPHFGQPHAEIHGGKRKINQTQIQHCGKTVALNGVIIFFQFVSYQ